MNEKCLGCVPLAAAAVLLSILLTVETRAMALVTDTLCSAQANENPLVKGRSKSITFPDGRILTVVGHFHGDRQIYEISDLTDNGRLSSMSDSEFNQLLTKIANENRKPYQGMITRQAKLRFVEYFKAEYGVDIGHTVRPEQGFDLPSLTVENHAIEDLQFLSQALAQPGSKIRFIGFEGSQQTWSNNLPYYVRARQELMRQFYIRKGRGQISYNQEQIEKLILSASNGNVYAYMTNPDLAKRVPMFGSEDPNAGEESQRVNPLQKMNDALQEVTKADDAYWDAKTEKEKQAFEAVPSNLAFVALLMHVYSEVQNMNISSFTQLDAMIGELRNQSPSWIKSSLEGLFRSFKERVRINFARDYESAKNLVSRHETGIHFVGLNHFNNTIANLENLCKQELNGASRATIHPPAVHK
jgi:hypothetical protein